MWFHHVLARLPGSLMDEAARRAWFVTDPRRARFRWVAAGVLFVLLWPMSMLADRGVQWWWRVLDCRRYIETVEADRLAAEERQAIFNRYLPYAQAFGVSTVDSAPAPAAALDVGGGAGWSDDGGGGGAWGGGGGSGDSGGAGSG